MEISILQNFCEEAGILSSPFSIDGYTYASNGHMCIRVPRLDDVTRPNPSGIDVSIDNLFDSGYDGDWTPGPDISQIPVEKCQECNGTGAIESCPECDGDGEVEYRGKTGNWTIECPCCENDGRKFPIECEHCGGSGIYEKITKNRLVGMARISLPLLRKIGSLPNALFLAPRQKETTTVFFKFAGGDGVVMRLDDSVTTDDGR